jgi:hypothetical protein
MGTKMDITNIEQLINLNRDHKKWTKQFSQEPLDVP